MDKIETLLRRAQEARANGNRLQEAALLDQALLIAPTSAQLLNSRGMVALALDRAEDAAAFFERAADQDSGQPALWMNLATARRQNGDEPGERVALDQVLAIDQTHFMGQLRMAEWQERNGALAAATESWSKVLALAAAINDPPPALQARLDEARAFVRGRMAGFAAEVDAEFAADFGAQPDHDVRRFRASIDHLLGRRRIYQNECAGIHYPFLPADEFFDREHFPWMAQLEAQTDIIRREFLALLTAGPDLLRPYVRLDSGTPDNKWTALDQSLDWSACFLWEYGARNDAVCDLCPATTAALEALPRSDINGRAPSAFFSLLKPKAHIPAHTGVTNTRAIIHLPLIVPPGCTFRVGGQTRAWEEGRAFAFDDTIEHEAWNDSEELRVVLIFDVWNPYLGVREQDMLRRYFALADRSAHRPEA